MAAELQALMSGSLPADDRFCGRLAFGTGGLRGVLGAGTNRMNTYTVRQATQGLANHLLKTRKSVSIAIAYDSRIKSRLFAEQAACVMAANRITAYIYPRLMPTPALSFTVRHLQCDAGICITASHNPPQYNGYKVYASDGCQITTEAAEAISAEIARVDAFADVQICPFDPHVNPYIRYIDEVVVEAYLKEIMNQRLLSGSQEPLKIVYSPLHGAGQECVKRILRTGGYKDVHIVPEQEMPDGYFRTCPSPNPEEDSALELSLQLARQRNADLVLATDPDCDRVGVAAYDNGRYVRLNGNELGILLLHYICTIRAVRSDMPENPVIIKTIVTSEMAAAIAKSFGVSVWNVLTGFKFIGEQIGLMEKQHCLERYLFGFEESCGYLTGTYVRDKDAVSAVLMVCDMAAYHKSQHKTLPMVLEELYEQFGYHLSSLDSFTFSGASGRRRMQRFMHTLRENPHAAAAFELKSVMDYSVGGAQGPDLPVLPPSDVLQLRYQDESLVTVRPSGTEPKLKVYCCVQGGSKADAKARLAALQTAFSSFIAQCEMDDNT